MRAIYWLRHKAFWTRDYSKSVHQETRGNQCADAWANLSKAITKLIQYLIFELQKNELRMDLYLVMSQYLLTCVGPGIAWEITVALIISTYVDPYLFDKNTSVLKIQVDLEDSIEVATENELSIKASFLQTREGFKMTSSLCTGSVQQQEPCLTFVISSQKERL